jgi:hypothetical protein
VRWSACKVSQAIRVCDGYQVEILRKGHISTKFSETRRYFQGLRSSFKQYACTVVAACITQIQVARKHCPPTKPSPPNLQIPFKPDMNTQYTPSTDLEAWYLSPKHSRQPSHKRPPIDVQAPAKEPLHAPPPLAKPQGLNSCTKLHHTNTSRAGKYSVTHGILLALGPQGCV